MKVKTRLSCDHYELLSFQTGVSFAREQVRIPSQANDLRPQIRGNPLSSVASECEHVWNISHISKGVSCQKSRLTLIAVSSKLFEHETKIEKLKQHRHGQASTRIMTIAVSLEDIRTFCRVKDINYAASLHIPDKFNFLRSRE